jgi:hypothetical protein
MAFSIYISDQSYGWVLQDLNYSDSESAKKLEIIQRAVGDFEADMAQKFVVPLQTKTGTAYSLSPSFAQNKVLNAIKDKIREIIGYDKNRNLTGTIDSTEKFLNVHGEAYKKQIKDLLNPKIDYGFLMLDQAQDAQTPVQHIGLSKADNGTDPIGNSGSGFY